MELERRWVLWEAMAYPREQYPPGNADGEVEGVDLSLLDGEAAYILDGYFRRRGLLRRRGLNDDNRTALPLVLGQLRRVVPELTGDAQAYFAAALAIIEEVASAEAVGPRGEPEREP